MQCYTPTNIILSLSLFLCVANDVTVFDLIHLLSPPKIMLQNDGPSQINQLWLPVWENSDLRLSVHQCFHFNCILVQQLFQRTKKTDLPKICKFSFIFAWSYYVVLYVLNNWNYICLITKKAKHQSCHFLVREGDSNGW